MQNPARERSRIKFHISLIALAGLVLVSCGPKPEPTPTLNTSMAGVVAPQAQILWDISSKAVNDDGDPDATKLKSEEWTAMAAAADQLKARMLVLAMAEKITVAGEGVKIQDEGKPLSTSAAQVQGFIDADPKAFSDEAKLLAGLADEFGAASRAHDAVKLQSASDRMDGVCEQCHLKFWYPNQAPPPAG